MSNGTAPLENPSPETPPVDPDALEFMEIMRMATQLRQEQNDIDGMFASLRGEEDIL